MQANVRRQKKNGNRARRTVVRALDDNHVPSYKPTVVVDHVFRFSNASSGVFTITAIQLLNTLAMASGTTVANPLVETMRVKRIRVWSPPSPTTFSSTATLDVGSTAVSVGPANPTIQVSDTALGSTSLAKLDFRPPKGSLMRDWFNRGSNMNFSFSLPANSIVDFHVKMALNDTAAFLGNITVAGAVVGVIYKLTLVAGFVPVAYPTI